VLQGVTTLKTKNGASEDSFVLVISSSAESAPSRPTNRGGAVPSDDSRGDDVYTSVADLRDIRGAAAACPRPLRYQSAGVRHSYQHEVRSAVRLGREFLRVSAFEPAGDTLVANGAGLRLVKFNEANNPVDLVLSTKILPDGPSYPALEPTLAPHQHRPVKCASADGCTFVAKGDGQPLATLGNVRLRAPPRG